MPVLMDGERRREYYQECRRRGINVYEHARRWEIARPLSVGDVVRWCSNIMGEPDEEWVKGIIVSVMPGGYRYTLMDIQGGHWMRTRRRIQPIK